MKVRIKITHRGAHFHALAKVARVHRDLGIGIEFAIIEQRDLRVLEDWVSHLRNKQT
jgi:hypothetical protein